MDMARLDEIIAEFEPELQGPMRRLMIWWVIKRDCGVETETLDGIIAALPPELHKPTRNLAKWMMNSPHPEESSETWEAR